MWVSYGGKCLGHLEEMLMSHVVKTRTCLARKVRLTCEADTVPDIPAKPCILHATMALLRRCIPSQRYNMKEAASFRAPVSGASL